MSNTAAEIKTALQHVDNLEVIIESLDYTKYLQQHSKKHNL